MRLFFLSALFLAFSSCVSCSPTSVYWTNCSTDVQQAKTYHFGAYNYIGKGASFPPDLALTYGFFSWKDLESEIGLDYLLGVKDPFYFNGKLAIREGKLFSNAPSFSIGAFGIGTSSKTNLSVVDAIVGYTLPHNLGRAFFGVYRGRKALGKKRSGWMVAYEKTYDAWQFVADYSSGNNVLGGGGFGIVYYFTPKIYLTTGPVWFTDTKTNGNWKWSLLLDIDL